MSSERLRNVSRLVQTYIDDRKLPGAISLVARRGKVVHFETYGNMDDERQKPMRTDTTFRFYSMTKPIASVALMMLYEEGRFQLDEQRTYFSGSGGLVSTAPDYLRFCTMLANGGVLGDVRILGPRTLQLMTLNHLPGGQDLATMPRTPLRRNAKARGLALGSPCCLTRQAPRSSARRASTTGVAPCRPRSS